MRTIGVIGNGFVGHATGLLECEEVKLMIYDVIPSKCKPEGCKMEDLSKCDIVFICVPTPMNKNGSCHLNIVTKVVSELKRMIDEEKTHIVIRSTVTPCTSIMLGTYFMPEFLTEKNWRNDFKTCKNWIFGLKGCKTDINFMKIIEEIFNSAKKYEKIDFSTIHFLNSKEAEMVKYFRNCFLATKVSFCNEIENYCNSKLINYSIVRYYATLDDRVGSNHSMVPGHDGKYGYGGTCFPKDMNALFYDMKKHKVPSYIIKGSIYRNKKIDRKEQDGDKGRAFI